jgi:hypothetical protein
MMRPTVVVVVGSLVLGFHIPTLVHSFAVVVSNRPTTKSSSYTYPSSFDTCLQQQQPKQCKVRHFPLFSTEASVSIDETSASITESNLDEKLNDCLQILNRAAETKAEDTDVVYQALVDLEQVSRLVGKLERQGSGSGSPSTGNRVARTALSSNTMVTQLNGSWRLVFTTGTAQTQKKLSGRINYFPLKAIQSFDTDSKAIANGIYLGDFCVLKFSGSFDFDTTKRRLEFDFDAVRLLDAFTIDLAGGQAARLGAASGLGSESNVVNTEQRKKLPFFNWISADATLATARGGGGGLALWKRVVDES